MMVSYHNQQINSHSSVVSYHDHQAESPEFDSHSFQKFY